VLRKRAQEWGKRKVWYENLSEVIVCTVKVHWFAFFFDRNFVTEIFKII